MASEYEILAKRLECPLCFELMTEPKQLSCTHTFCKNCLTRLYQCQTRRDNLPCPTCRQNTRLENGDVSNLQTNFPIKALIGDLQGTKSFCTVCDQETKSISTIYCQTCGEYLCESCLDAHDKYRKNANHKLTSVEDIKKGKVTVKSFCHIHLNEEKLWMCTTCNIAVCLTCRMLQHNSSSHTVETISEVQESTKTRVQSLQQRAKSKVTTLRNLTQFVREQIVKVETTLEKKKSEIDKIYTEAMQQLTENKDRLISQYDLCKHNATVMLGNILDITKKEEESVNSLSALVGNGVKKVLEGDSATMHNSLCKDLDEVLRKTDPNQSDCINVSKQAQNVEFFKYSGDKQFEMGQILGDWDLRKHNKISISPKDVWHIHPLLDGGVAVACDGGMDICHLSLSNKVVLSGTDCYRVSTLSDGRVIVRDRSSGLTLHKQTWERLKTKYEIKNDARGGGMCTDKFNNIYVGYSMKIIDVFRPGGGEPKLTIHCQDYAPNCIFHMNHSKSLLVRDTTTVRLIDEVGSVIERVENDNLPACPAVLKDDSIIIGWIKGDYLTVDLYTPKLQFVKEVLTNFKIRTSKTHVYLCETATGDIAINDAHNLYILKKKRWHDASD